MAARNRRISKEIEDCQKQDSSNLQVEIVGDALNHLIGTFEGPSETPYAGGHFQVDIKIPTDYPFRPPVMKFITRIYHPNISSQTGAICLDILKEQWSPVLTIKSALVSLQSMLGEPQPNDPQDAEVASHYLRDRASFDSTAAYWTRQYASATTGEEDELQKYGLESEFVQQFTDMGFTQQKVVEVLRRLHCKSSRDVKSVDGGINAIVEQIMN